MKSNMCSNHGYHNKHHKHYYYYYYTVNNYNYSTHSNKNLHIFKLREKYVKLNAHVGAETAVSIPVHKGCKEHIWKPVHSGVGCSSPVLFYHICHLTLHYGINDNTITAVNKRYVGTG